MKHMGMDKMWDIPDLHQLEDKSTTKEIKMSHVHQHNEFVPTVTHN
jgi:hypothetical protein